jgi:hypothetical protein
MKNNTTKIVAVTNPGAIVDNTAFSSTAIDCLGFAYLSVFCMFGAMDIAMAGLKLQECDAVGGSYVDITGAAYTGAALPSATSDNLIYGSMSICSAVNGSSSSLRLVAMALLVHTWQHGVRSARRPSSRIVLHFAGLPR